MAKILIIEDDLALKPMWEIIAKRNLKNPELHWAVSSEVAKKLFLDSVKISSPYMFIVVDLFLAGSETGLDFIKFARNYNADIPILITSSAEDVNTNRFMQRGMKNVSVLSKPLNIPNCERILDGLIA